MTEHETVVGNPEAFELAEIVRNYDFDYRLTLWNYAPSLMWGTVRLRPTSEFEIMFKRIGNSKYLITPDGTCWSERRSHLPPQPIKPNMGSSVRLQIGPYDQRRFPMRRLRETYWSKALSANPELDALVEEDLRDE